MFKKLFGSNKKKFKFNIKKPTTKTCPNCGAKLEKIPDWKNGKMDCPHCEGIIVVRSGRLFTEDEANVRDSLESTNRCFYDYEITREKFNRTREKLSEQFGFVASVNDTLWRMLNLMDTPDNRYEKKREIYLAMRDILRKEGKTTNDISAKINRLDLVRVKELNDESGIQMVAKIRTANDSNVCDECRKLSKKGFTIDEALKTMPIPNKCTNENCRCGWSFELPDDD